VSRPGRVTRVERYVIRGGKEGYERLLLLSRDRWPDTAALFARAGLSPGMRCIDLGCGGGEVTMEIARLVAPDGSVVGVDMDKTKLDLARHAAAARGLGNVEFRLLNVHDWDEPGGYDAVYSRFLLQHLSQPVDLLRRMWAGVRPWGVLIVEDADHDGCCHPPDRDSISSYGLTARYSGSAAGITRWGASCTPASSPRAFPAPRRP
jgi:2-polyprenyl-3-methyl-5-hydroxy-6-metoxy-1,4-benzoquinol methylase